MNSKIKMDCLEIQKRFILEATNLIANNNRFQLCKEDEKTDDDYVRLMNFLNMIAYENNALIKIVNEERKEDEN